MARMYISERPPVPIRAMRALPPLESAGAAAVAAPVATAELDSAVLTIRGPFGSFEAALWKAKQDGTGVLLHRREKAFSRFSNRFVSTRPLPRQPLWTLK